MKKSIFLTPLCLAASVNAVASPEKTAVAEPSNVDITSPFDMDAQLDSARWSQALDEVVVTGQGSGMQKRRLSSNVSTIKAEQLTQLNTSRLDEMLQTAVSNMQINLSNGQPGAASMMRSRGISSVQVNSTPVIYVDGVRIDNSNTATAMAQKLNEQGIRSASASSSLNDIPMENIERIEYVNGGAATTLYGSDAANGVIQIFTRKGHVDGFHAQAEIQLGWEEANSQFYHYSRTKDLVNQTGLMQLYRLSLENGGERGGWSFAAAASFNDGTIVANNNRNKKYDARFGSHYQLLHNLTYSNSLGFVHNDYMRSRNGNEGYYSSLWLTESGAASSMTYDGEDGAKHSFDTNIDQMDDYAYSQFRQFIRQSESLQNKRSDINRFQMSHELLYTPLRDLTVKGIFGLDYRYEGVKNIITNELIEAMQYTGPVSTGNVTEYNRYFCSVTFDINAQHNYAPTDWLSMVSTAGFQYFSNNDRQHYNQAVGVEDGTTRIDDTNRTYSDYDHSSLYNYGFYLQENMGFKDRYYLDLGLRGDHNSGFGDNVGWQYYPKVGISYLLTSEPFMKTLEETGILGQMRIYANYGVAGNYPPAFAWQRTITFDQYQGQQSAAFGQYGNANLRPEKKHSFEVGFNSQWLNGYLQLGVAYYNPTTHDALFSVHTTPSTGQSTTYLANVGKIRNRGFEFSIGSDFVRTKNWKASFHASLNTLDNKVLSTGGEVPFGIGTFAEEALIQNMVSEGKSIGWLRGNKAVFNDDGTYSHTEELADLGSTLPDFYGSLSLNVDYRNFSFFANADYSVGGVVYDLDRHFRWRYGETDDAVDESWVPEGMTHKQVWTNFTSLFIEDADYLKIRTLGASYRLDMKKAVRSLTFSITCYNPFSFTKAEVDPESTLSDAASYGGVSVGGIAYGSHSRPRQFVGSVKVMF